ncbi:MAG: hypothetical protein LUG18_00475 [Candidatus Azobacteroides sp.]|nr:hypothetical protein [Candidatus Azobacteroides sp.]
MSIRPWNLVPGSTVRWINPGSASWVKTATIADDVLYVDSETGDDTTGTGAPELPFKTLGKAFSEASSDVVCRGVFEEDMTKGNVAYPCFYADVPYGATYIGTMPQDTNNRLHFQNEWVFSYNSGFFGVKGLYTAVSGFLKNTDEKRYFAMRNSKDMAVCSSYRQDVNFFISTGFSAYTGCVEGATVAFKNVGGGMNVVLKDCRILVGSTSEIELELTGETDEEKTQSLVSQLNTLYNTTNFSGVKVTTKPLFNDPENGDLSIHPESVVRQNKIYINSREYIYPSVFPVGIQMKILPDLTGEKYAFDERTIHGYIRITENNTLEPVRDEFGDYIDEGSIDSKVITLQKGIALKGIHAVFENDELNGGLRLGESPWQNLQVRYKYSIGSVSDLSTLNPESVYINTNDFNFILKDSTTAVERIVVPGESFVVKENESVRIPENGARVGIFYEDDSGWMDCLPATDLLVKRVGDEYVGAVDRDEDGNALTNANPAFYSDENRVRPDFPLVAKYVQYRVKIKGKK